MKLYILGLLSFILITALLVGCKEAEGGSKLMTLADTTKSSPNKNVT